MRRTIFASLALAALSGAAVLALSEPAQALPMYAQRSGRTCANCHVSPTLEDPEGWDNPELLQRKCTLSCVSCHTDPTGGGMRNASGRYYGQSTVAIVPTQERSYSDHHRELLSSDQIWRIQQFLDADPKTTEAHGERTIPSDWTEAQAGVGAGQTGNQAAWGHPLGGDDVMAFWDGRYDDLNADPLLNLSGDFRAAWWSGSRTFFPMQAELSASLHPMHHLMFMGTVAAKGHTTGGAGPVFPRRAFVMANELPGMSWVKAGIFMPSFGTYTDDHTLYVREGFEQDVSDPDDTVLGVEVGTAPNYPFAQASVFLDDPAQLLGPVPGAGWGAAVNGGFRDLGWSLSGHAQLRDRDGKGKGDLLAAGVAWGFNPAYYLERVPMTLLGEVSMGRRTVGGSSEAFAASWAEASWMVRNGVTAKARHEMKLPTSTMVLEQRYGLGVDVGLLPGVTLGAMGRVSPYGGVWRKDLFVQAHLWF
ncbi:MAG: hypothetical protein H6739_37600 [Alphaproteobacteria bacterium]|nr:hypothetical protein [Alphaproteobacteria bacterium]